MNKNIKLEKGDIVTYKYSKGLEPRTTTVQAWSGLTVKDLEYRCNYKVLKVARQQTIYEFKEILDEQEKEYLSAVIRPFKGRVDYIKKFDITGKECICIRLKNDEYIDFPYFKKGTMYKGMYRGKKYTLKELGLD